MIQQSIKISYEMSDSAVLGALGNFVRETRLRQNKTQEDVASAAGIERMTLVRFEKGEGGTLATFIRLLRSLQQFHVLSQFIIPSQISPLQLAKLEQEKRKRARGKKPGNNMIDKQSNW